MRKEPRRRVCPCCEAPVPEDAARRTCGKPECRSWYKSMTVADGTTLKKAVLAETGQWNLASKVDAYSRDLRGSQASGTCWDWTGGLAGKSGREYGVLYFDGKQYLAHRASYQAFILKGEPNPEGMDILQKCGNTLCVRPDHLEAAPRSKSVLASVKRGTHGRKNYHITPEVAETIRALVYVGQFENADIAQKYDISAGQVSKIAHRQIYSDRPLNEEELEALKRRDHEARKRARSKQRKLADKHVREIKVSGEDRTILAERYGVHRSYIDSIMRGEARTDIE